jgi:hypothetical protein
LEVAASTEEVDAFDGEEITNKIPANYGKDGRGFESKSLKS